MKKWIIVGGSKTGREELIDELKIVLPEFCFLSDPVVIKGDSLDFWRGKMKEMLELEASIPEGVENVVLQSSLVDVYAFAKMNDEKQMADELKGMIEKANYQKVFFCDLVDDDEARQSQQKLKGFYQELGVEVVDLPAESIATRMNLFRWSLS